MDSEFQRELALLQQDGLKTNPMRLAYEEKVRGLRALKEELLAQGCALRRSWRTGSMSSGGSWDGHTRRWRLRHPAHRQFGPAADLEWVHPVV